MAILRCKSPFAARINGVPRVVAADQLVDSGDPVVAGREHHFESVDSYMARRSGSGSPVEEATAVPGAKRTRSSKQASKE